MNLVAPNLKIFGGMSKFGIYVYENEVKFTTVQGSLKSYFPPNFDTVLLNKQN
jgi:hypothetical protein